MVIKNVPGHCFLLTLLLYSNICFASPKLLVFTDKNESELGRPVRVELYGISLKNKLSEINLSNLNKNFGIVTEYSTEGVNDPRWPKQAVQILRLKLYPRQTGNIIIPSLSTGNVHSTEKSLKVFAGPEGVPQFTISSSSPYERQQFIVQMKITSRDLTSRLTINDQINIPGFESSPLLFKRSRQNNGRYLLKTGWALTALKNGVHQLNLPPVEYSVSGVLRKKYYLPLQQLNIKMLPSYLPPTIPVAEISIQGNLSQNIFFKTDSVIYWDIQLKGELNNAYTLPPVLRQLKSNDKIKFFPVNSSRKTQAFENNLISSVNHSIPFKIKKSGFFTPPEIKLQYFDPAQGKIKSIVFKTKKLLALNAFWTVILAALLALFSFYTIRLIYFQWQGFQYSTAKQKEAINLLQNISAAEDIREAIRLLSEAEYWPRNTSLSQWSHNWSEKYLTDARFSKLVNSISQVCYAQYNKDRLNNIAKELTDIINNKKPVKPFVIRKVSKFSRYRNMQLK